MAARKKSARSRAAARRKPASRQDASSAASPGADAAGAPDVSPDVSPDVCYVEALVALMERHGLLELEYRVAPDGARDVRLSRRAGEPLSVAPLLAAHGHAHAPESAAAVRPEAAAPAAAPAPAESELYAFTSPMVGTFYRAPSPEAAPFVSVGDTVDETTTVCIIEAMKVMNEITPDRRGEVVSIEVENGEAVEFGQALFLIRPL